MSDKIKNRVYMNSHDIPVKKEGESDADFEARMEFFRKNDMRVPIAGKGKPNFGFTNNYNKGQGIINNGDDTVMRKMVDGDETGDKSYDPAGGSSFSIV